MFLKYFDFLFKPFRELGTKIQKVKTVKGNFQVDVNRVKQMGGQGKAMMGDAQGKVAGLQGQVGAAQGAAAGAQQQMQQMQGPPGAPGAPGGFPGGINPNPPIRVEGLLKKRKICTQCNQQLDPTWDACPYCAQAAAQAAAAMAPPKAPMKTQAFMLDAGGGGGGSMQLLGWLVPLQGMQRGELFTLAPQSLIGTDPTSTVVLLDKFMSSKHAEIKAEGGVWMLKDLGSTNGTFVNDKRVDKQELVDNDVIKFGGSLVKFKSL